MRFAVASLALAASVIASGAAVMAEPSGQPSAAEKPFSRRSRAI